MNKTFIVGKELRQFQIAYCDKNNNPYYDNITILNNGELTSNEIVSGFINDLKERGYCVYMIVEINPFKTFEEVEKLIETNPTEGRKNVRLLYIDREKNKTIPG